MQKTPAYALLFLCIVMVLVAGCTNSASAPAPVATPVPTMLPTLATTAPTSAVTIVQPAPPLQTAAVVILVTTAFPTTAPILHRWVRQYTDKNSGQLVGYEFKFYPDGTLNYREGTPKMVSDNIRLDPVSGSTSGTWTSLGDNKYLVKIYTLIREYTRVAAHENKLYPGVIIPEHIESSYEKDAINPVRVKGPDEMYYPERAKTD